MRRIRNPLCRACRCLRGDLTQYIVVKPWENQAHTVGIIYNVVFERLAGQNTHRYPREYSAKVGLLMLFVIYTVAFPGRLEKYSWLA